MDFYPLLTHDLLFVDMFLFVRVDVDHVYSGYAEVGYMFIVFVSFFMLHFKPIKFTFCQKK